MSGSLRGRRRGQGRGPHRRRGVEGQRAALDTSINRWGTVQEARFILLIVTLLQVAPCVAFPCTHQGLGAHERLRGS